MVVYQASDGVACSHHWYGLSRVGGFHIISAWQLSGFIGDPIKILEQQPATYFCLGKFMEYRFPKYFYLVKCLRTLVTNYRYQIRKLPKYSYLGK